MYFAPERARALLKKSQILELDNQPVKAEGVRLNAEKEWRDWYRNTHPEWPATMPSVINYDAHIPFWAR